eukprot:NODE_10_length_61504_cov_0.956502.p16 type:complete len:440 gc:universal NODE_10_length_61504_cov_0.956502:10448-9129(-)
MSLKKLLIEIDKCLKKVGEGLAHFDQIYEKILQVSNQSQRDKLEQDLKKEIKKLQRNRDQIKLYLQKDEIKDKRALEENKRLIETQMERFKAMERELKLKAFSKEGLAQQIIDPKEKEKNEASDWIAEQLSQFEGNIEKFEYEIEQLEGNKKMKNKNKDKLEELEQFIERHKYHQGQLEILLRMLENGKVEPGEIEDIKDSVQYYLENYEEDDGMDEGIYDDFDLNQQEEVFGMIELKKDELPTPTANSSSLPPKRSNSSHKKEEETPSKSIEIKADSPVKKEQIPIIKPIETSLPAVDSPGKSPLPTAQFQSPQLKGFADMLKDEKLKERPLPGQVPSSAAQNNNAPVLNFRAAIKTSAPGIPLPAKGVSDSGKIKKEAHIPTQDISVPQAFEDLLASFNHAKNTAFTRSVEECSALFEASLKYIPTSHDIIPYLFLI